MLPGMNAAMIIGLGGEPWTPASFIPHAWYDAELSAKTVSGGLVQQWNDLSGAGLHLTQPTSGNRPSYSAADQWLEFGANRWIGGQVLLPTGNGEWTVASVIRVPTVPTNNASIAQVWKQGSAASNAGVELSVGVWNGPYNRIAFMYTNNNVGAGSVNIAAATDYIVVWRRTPTNRSIWINGVQVLNNSYSAANLGTTHYHFGNVSEDQVSGTTQQRTNIVWRSALGDAVRQKVEGYLAWLWGLQASLPADHPYRYSPPMQVTGEIEPGQATFLSSGSFVVPENVTSICAVAVGGGHFRGGDLRWRNAIAVTPGEVLTVTVGTNGSPTQLQRGGTSLLAARGGSSGTSTATGGDVGGGDGGTGGNGSDDARGGGGAGGYSGNGGNGGTGGNGAAGSGGGGGGGGGSSNGRGGGGGGGVGLMGQGANGTAGSGGSGAGSGGGGGSGGANGTNGTNGSSDNGGSGGNGGLYGAGAAEGGYRESGESGGSGSPGTAAAGALRLIWGPGRAFPSTNTGDV